MLGGGHHDEILIGIVIASIVLLVLLGLVLVILLSNDRVRIHRLIVEVRLMGLGVQQRRDGCARVKGLHPPHLGVENRYLCKCRGAGGGELISAWAMCTCT